MNSEVTANSEKTTTEKIAWYRWPWVRSGVYFVFIWLLVPALAQAFLFLFAAGTEPIRLKRFLPDGWGEGLAIFVITLTPLCLGYVCRFSKKRLPKPDQTFFQRYKVEVGVILYTLLLCCSSMFLSHEMFINKELHPVVWIGLPSFIFIFVVASFGAPFYFYFLVPVACYSLYFLGVLMKTWRLGHFRVQPGGLLPVVLLAVFLTGGCAWKLYEQQQGLLTPEERNMETVSEGGSSRWYDRSDDIQYRYRPFEQNEDVLTPLKEEAQLHIDADFPRLDGATALFPIYASAVQAIYKAPETEQERQEMRRLVDCNRTPNAYQRLIDGEVDLIFVAGPSTKQIEAAKEKGLELTLTPIGKEAFVFLVNEQNSVQSLTVEQIRDIYAGKINRWDEVGGAAKEIRAFQRPEGSGSQTAMVKRVMQGASLREPLREEFYQGMGGMVVGVANYRNAENAIGYSFRFYATAMNKVEGIKLLTVNGVSPTRENIRNGSYPFTGEIYMVTAYPVSENTQKLMDWFLSEQGQQLIDDVGYVSLAERI